MKRIIALIMTTILMLCLFAGCSNNGNETNTTTEPQTTESQVPQKTGVEVKLAGLQGPTGMGMSYLLKDAEEGNTLNNYTTTISSAPDEVTAALVKGDYDIAALPSNAAATLYNKTQGKVKLLALNTGCILYVLEKGNTINSIADLKGKTVYISGQGATPEYLMNYILEKNGLTVGTDVKLDYTYATHPELLAFAVSGKADVVILPEPMVTAALAQNSELRVALDINDVWHDTIKGTDYEGTEVAMGCVAVNTAFAEAHPDAVAAFLYEYEQSINKVLDTNNLDTTADIIASVGIVAKAPVAKMALPRCNIMYVAGDELKQKIEGFYQVIFDANPNSIGGAMPDANFYYSAK